MTQFPTSRGFRMNNNTFFIYHPLQVIFINCKAQIFYRKSRLVGLLDKDYNNKFRFKRIKFVKAYLQLPSFRRSSNPNSAGTVCNYTVPRKFQTKQNATEISNSTFEWITNRTKQFSSIRVNPFKPEFTTAIFIHYKPRIAVAIPGLQWIKMIWCGWKIKENCSVLVNQFHGNFRSKTPSCGGIQSVFRDVKWCFNASWWPKGLNDYKILCCRIQNYTNKYWDLIISVNDVHCFTSNSITWIIIYKLYYACLQYTQQVISVLICMCLHILQ